MAATATLGTNFLAKNPGRVWRQIHKAMGLRSLATTGRRIGRGLGGIAGTSALTVLNRRICVYAKNGAPATNTAGDEPAGGGDLCYDYTNLNVYRCTVYTSSSVFTWLKINA